MLRLVLSDRPLKLFKHGLQSLHKIGSDLMIEAHPSRLCLRTISSSQSAYMSISYGSNFFSAYDVFNCNVTQAVVLFKHILSVFRTQKVARLVLELRTADARVMVTLHCENGLLKSYKFPTIDGELLVATAQKDEFPAIVVAETSAMAKLLSTFHSSLSELTIIAYAEAASQLGGKHVQLCSYLDPTMAALDQSLHTKLFLDAGVVFDSYVQTADEAVEATFNINDLRAMLGFCESLGAHIKLTFKGPGEPLVAEPHFPPTGVQDVDYEAELILATLTPGPTPAMASPPAASAQQPAEPAPERVSSDFTQEEPAPAYNVGDPPAFEMEEGIPSTPPDEQLHGATMPGVIVSHTSF